jgi:hypothetical protein
VSAAAVGRNIEAIAAMADESKTAADEAKDAARRAAEAAGNAAEASDGAARAAAQEAVDAAEALLRDYKDGAANSAAEAAAAAESAGTDAGRAHDAAERAEAAANKAESGAPVAAHTVLADELPAGADFTVPGYVVGSGKLRVYLLGLLCQAGGGEPCQQYREVGQAGEASATIQFNDTLSVGMDVTAVSEA